MLELKLIRKAVPFIVVLLIILAIIFILQVIISGKKADLVKQQSEEETIEKALTNVVTLTITPGMIQEKLTLPGLAKPWISLEVVAEIKGKITHKKTDKGHHVQKGDILAVIDKSDYQNSYDSAFASYKTAAITQKRFKALAKENFVTKSNLDDANAMVKTTKAALENAKLALNRCTIRSPMRGIVNRVYIENGRFLNPGDPIVQILQIDKLKIEVGIPESDVDAVRKLKYFNMTIDAIGGKTCKGEYHYLSKSTDSMAKLYNLEIMVDNSDGQILSDMFVRVEIIKHQDSNGIAIPMYALITSNNNKGVYIENNGLIQFQPVVTGFQTGWQTQILSGLKPGNKVVVVGHRIIEDGQKVNVINNITNIKELTR